MRLALGPLLVAALASAARGHSVEVTPVFGARFGGGNTGHGTCGFAGARRR